MRRLWLLILFGSENSGLEISDSEPLKLTLLKADAIECGPRSFSGGILRRGCQPSNFFGGPPLGAVPPAQAIN
jgi:hypothetical protein